MGNSSGDKPKFAAPPIGTINPALTYTEDEAKRVGGFRYQVWRRLRDDAGLKILKVGRRNYVHGHDLIEAMSKLAELALRVPSSAFKV